MPFYFDTAKYTIAMACGDTGNIQVNIDWEQLSEGDVVVFAIFDKATAQDLLVKTIKIENGEAAIRLCNHDTRDIPAGNQNWNLRIVTNPALDDDGNAYADDCTDDVVTVFNVPPVFKLTSGGAYV